MSYPACFYTISIVVLYPILNLFIGSHNEITY